MSEQEQLDSHANFKIYYLYDNLYLSFPEFVIKLKEEYDELMEMIDKSNHYGIHYGIFGEKDKWVPEGIVEEVFDVMQVCASFLRNFTYDGLAKNGQKAHMDKMVSRHENKCSGGCSCQ
jgi:hypothetical protein